MARKKAVVDNPDDLPPVIDNPDGGSINIETYDSTTQGGFGGFTQVSRTNTEEPITSKQAADRWRHRRRMAYIALSSMIVATGLIFFAVSESRLESLKDPIGWFFISMASIVGAYVGFATYSDVIGRR